MKNYNKKYIFIFKIGSASLVPKQKNVSAALAYKKKKKNLFIFISNTYSGINELPGVIIDRQNILKSLNIQKYYGKIFSDDNFNYQFREDFNILFITNCNKEYTIHYLESVSRKYDIYSIFLCLSGHGSNDTGIINFYSQSYERINLSEIIQAIDNPYLFNITAFLDVCRSGERHNPFNTSILVNSIEGKRVAVITAGSRTFSVGGGIDGGKLIGSLCKVLKQDNIYKSLNSMEEMLKFINAVVFLRIKNRVDKKNWIEIIKKRKQTEYKNLYDEICKELPSLYFNYDTRQVILERNLLKNFRSLFKLLCKEYDEDSDLCKAAGKTYPTKLR